MKIVINKCYGGFGLSEDYDPSLDDRYWDAWNRPEEEEDEE